MDDYKPVTVEAARQIGQHFEMGVVVILSMDSKHNLMHCTTWGDSAAQKALAADLGDQLARSSGIDFSKLQTFEDYRTRTQAESAQIIDRLTQERDALAKVRTLDDELRQILGRPNFACARIAELLRMAGQQIDFKAEAEQAAVLHWLLNLYLDHGTEWAPKAREYLRSIVGPKPEEPSTVEPDHDAE